MKVKILNVVYNSSNNELVRTNTLVKNTIVKVDATPFRNHLLRHYFGLSEKESETFELDMTKWTDETVGNSNKKFV